MHRNAVCHRRPSLAVAAVAAALGAALASVAPADAAVYRTPGYRGVRRAPRTVPRRPPRPLTLSSAGERPQVLVDAAGTAHVVWNERGTGDAPDVLRYCRVRRGGAGCEVDQRLVPEQPYEGGNAPGLNDDVGVPRVLALNDQLALLTNRFPNTFTGPDGHPHDSNTYLFASDDGGTGFGPPALVGSGATSGQPGVYGSPEALRIGLVSDTQTGGTFFQEIAPGRYSGTTSNLGGDGIDSSVAAIDGRPAVAFASTGAQTTVRVWGGQGAVEDPAAWTTSPPVAGDSPRLAGGPGGLHLITRSTGSRELSVRRVGPDGALGAARTIPRSAGAALADLTQDGSGRLVASYRQLVGEQDELVWRTSTDGRTWSAPQLLRRASPLVGTWDADLAAAPDGGGFSVVWQSSSGQPGPILGIAFGNQGPTGQPGLGGLAGGQAPPDVVETCQRIQFGSVRVVADGGCLLSAAGQRGVKVSEGLLRLNGLEIVPEGSARIMLNARRRAIDTTGTVRVQLRAPGIDPIVLFRGELHVSLPDEQARASANGPGCSGQRLAGFDGSRVDVEGFPVRGSIEVFLQPDTACIPIALKLPDAFGGISGEAVLRASNARGLVLDSLRIEVAQALIGPVLLEDLLVAYRADADEWAGRATLGLPPQPGGAKLGAAVRFVRGAFREGSLELTIPYPGLPLEPTGVAYLKRVSGGFGLDPLTISVGAGIGLIPATPPVYAFEVDGRLTVTFAEPVVFRFEGRGKMFTFPIAESELLVRTDGFASTRATIDMDLVAVSVRGGMSAFVDIRSETFGGRVFGEVCVTDLCPTDAEAVFSSRGIGACVTPLAFGYRWGRPVTDADVMFGSCDLSDYEVRPPAGAAGRRDAGARAAQAGGAVTVAAGQDVLSLRLRGEGGLPDVTLVAPDGRRIVPATGAAALDGSAPAVMGRVPAQQTAYVAVRRPAAGTWRVEANPGTPAIRELASARPLPAPSVSGRVGGRARARTLAYRTTTGDGLATTFVERWATGEAPIGTARRARGTLRFAPAAGPRGRREIVAVVERDGVPRLQRTIARYTAPAPLRPGRVRGLRVLHRGGGIVVRYRGVRGARAYAVRVDLPDGRRLLRVLGARGRSVRVGAVGRRERALVRVTARDAFGRSGPPARARG